MPRTSQRGNIAIILLFLVASIGVAAGAYLYGKGSLKFSTTKQTIAPGAQISVTPVPTTTNGEITLTVSGYVYKDMNCNQKRDSGEQGIFNAQVEIDNVRMDVNTKDVLNVDYTTTNENGFYSYSAKSAQPAKWELALRANGGQRRRLDLQTFLIPLWS